MNYLDKISIKELQYALEEVEGNKPNQRLLAAIAYKTGVTRPNSLSGMTRDDERFTVGSCDLIPTNRSNWPQLIISEPVESESSLIQSFTNFRKLHKTTRQNQY